MNRNRAHAAFPKGNAGAATGDHATCYACGKPVSWDGHRWLHTPTPVKGKR